MDLNMGMGTGHGHAHGYGNTLSTLTTCTCCRIVTCGLAWPAHGLVWFGLERDRLAVPRYPNSVLSRCFAEAQSARARDSRYSIPTIVIRSVNKLFSCDSSALGPSLGLGPLLRFAAACGALWRRRRAPGGVRADCDPNRVLRTHTRKSYDTIVDTAVSSARSR